MALIKKILGSLGGCARGGHKVDRQRVRHVKGDLHASCKRCGMQLIRYGPDDWRPADQS